MKIINADAIGREGLRGDALLIAEAGLGAIDTPFLIYLNNWKLPKEIRPGWFTNIAMSLTSIFFMYFAVRIIIDWFGRLT